MEQSNEQRLSPNSKQHFGLGKNNFQKFQTPSCGQKNETTKSFLYSDAYSRAEHMAANLTRVYLARDTPAPVPRHLSSLTVMIFVGTGATLVITTVHVSSKFLDSTQQQQQQSYCFPSVCTFDNQRLIIHRCCCFHHRTTVLEPLQRMPRQCRVAGSRGWDHYRWLCSSSSLVRVVLKVHKSGARFPCTLERLSLSTDRSVTHRRTKVPSLLQHLQRNRASNLPAAG